MQKIKRDLLPFIRCFPFISHCYSSLTLLTFARFCIPLITIRLSIILFSIAERSYPGNLSAVVGCLIASNSEFFHFSNCQIEIVWVFSESTVKLIFFCLTYSKISMPQLDKLTYFSQFFWLCLCFFTFYILLFNNNNGILGISRILKLRNQLLSHRGNQIQSKDPKNLENISRKGFRTGLSYMYSSLSEVSQWCKTVDYLGKRKQITLISDFSEISGSRGMESKIRYLISKSSYKISYSRITCWKNIMLTHVPHVNGSII